MHLILNLRLQVQITEQPRDHFSDVLRCQRATLAFGVALDDLFFNRLFDAPEYVGILNLFEDELALLLNPEGHVGATRGLARTVIEAIVHLILLN